MILEPQQQLQLDNVLSSFPSVFSDKPGLTSLVSHSVPLAHQEAFRQEIENLLALGIIEPSTSLRSSSPMPIKKMVGGIRIDIDYRKLNNVTIHNPFSMPSIDDMLAHLGNAKFFKNGPF